MPMPMPVMGDTDGFEDPEYADEYDQRVPEVAAPVPTPSRPMMRGRTASPATASIPPVRQTAPQPPRASAVQVRSGSGSGSESASERLNASQMVSPPSVIRVPANLAAAGLEEIIGETIPRLFVGITAQEKCGKTHLACTLPGPIVIITCDTGTVEVATKFKEQTGKKFLIRKTEVPKAGGAKSDYEKYWQSIQETIEYALNDKSIRSLAIDTITELWEMMRLAKFGKLTQVKPHHYGPVNAEFREFIKHIYHARPDLNVCLLSKVKKEYKELKGKDDSAWTGKWERAGFADIPYLVDTNIDAFYIRPQTVKGDNGIDYVAEGGEGRFALRVSESRTNHNMIGLVLEGEDCNLPNLGLNLWPQTEIDYWL